MSIRPKPIKFLLRMEQETYQELQKLANKYNVSLNSEINTLLECCLKRWNVKTVKVRDIPKHLEDVQDEDWEKEYDNQIKEIYKEHPEMLEK